MLSTSRDFQHNQAGFPQQVVRGEILLYLSVNGPSQWSEIYTFFEQRSTAANVTHALRSLASGEFITLTTDGLIAITASGVEQLQCLE